VGGEPATLYKVHNQAQDDRIDTQIWISKLKGLPLKQVYDLDVHASHKALRRVVNDFATHHGPQDFRVLELLRRNRKNVSINEHKIRLFAWGDAPDGALLVHGASRVSGVCQQHRFTGHSLRSIQNAFRSLAGFRLINRFEYVGG
jgi:hypothetical protein